MLRAWPKRIAWSLIAAFASAQAASGDTGARAGDASGQLGWNWEPLIVLNLSLFGWLYLRGAMRIRQCSRRRRHVQQLQFAAFAAALAALVAALVSPLDALAEHLASAHMVQHLLLMMVAAPLVVLGRAGIVLNAGLPRSWRNDLAPLRRLFQVVARAHRSALGALATWLGYAVVLWAWHLPALYQTALDTAFVHDLQHLTFFVAGILFWRQIVGFVASPGRNAIVAVAFLFSTSLHASVLGIFMALSPRPWYPAYNQSTLAWNLMPLEDQQLAGLMMWVPACMIYPAAAALIFGLWLHRLANAGLVALTPLSSIATSTTAPVRGA